MCSLLHVRQSLILTARVTNQLKIDFMELQVDECIHSFYFLFNESQVVSLV